MTMTIEHPAVADAVEARVEPARQPTRVHTILVPLDGSRFSQVALGPAQELGEWLGAEIVLVRAVVPVAVPHVSTNLAAQLGETDAYISLMRAADSLRRAGLAVREFIVTSAPVEHATAARAILTAADATDADLLVMATHGRSGLQRTMLGSVAEDVLKETSLPVLLIHPNPSESSASLFRATRPDEEASTRPRILVGIDEAPHAQTVLARATAIAEDLGAVVEAIHLRPEKTAFGAAQALLARAAATGACMLVVGTRARRGLSRLLFGSVASDVIARAELPVLVVPVRG